ncbi:MAG: hypothetical protein LBH37_02815 [Oscillospiraceae bacterium]|jgi:hypothetical protein|nr:hypothetical protein [Oscillospiraceae bacterium]
MTLYTNPVLEVCKSIIVQKIITGKNIKFSKSKTLPEFIKFMPLDLYLPNIVSVENKNKNLVNWLSKIGKKTTKYLEKNVSELKFLFRRNNKDAAKEKNKSNIKTLILVENFKIFWMFFIATFQISN